MVTQSATILERHLLHAGEPPHPPAHAHTDFQKLASVLTKRKVLTKEDPMSHRIIEKRRRDRMNNCLADLSRLIPADYMKKGRGRIEKTEIIEMAIKHMKHLQDHHTNCHLGKCEMDQHHSIESEDSYSPPEPVKAVVLATGPLTEPSVMAGALDGPVVEEHYRLGYHECLSEAMHFLVEVEGMFAGDKLCVQLISHLQRHCDKILKSRSLNAPREHTETALRSRCSSSRGKERSPQSGSSSDGGGPASTDEGYYTHTSPSSQLRDILTSNSHLQPLTRLKMIPEPPSPSNSLNGASSQMENHLLSGSLYKFKNNIKQRFSAEHSCGQEQAEPLALKRRRPSEETSSVPSPPPISYTPPPIAAPPLGITHYPGVGVPIFALHSKGSFYIPLTVDHQLLAPFLSELSCETNLASLVLHPVTISVNFQHSISRPLKQPLCLGQSSLGTPWSPHIPLQKWATCAPDRN